MLPVRNRKGQNTGGALAVTKGLVGKLTPALCMVKNALVSYEFL